MNHIIVIGFKGSGKTRVGKHLSELYNLEFVDVDKKIVKNMNMSVKEIYQRFGEPFYRALETRELKELLQSKKRMIVSLGAGIPVQEQNQKYMKDLGTIVYLKGSFDILWNRLSTVGTNDSQEKMKRLYQARTPIYEKFADIVVETGMQTFDELVNQIVTSLCEKDSSLL